MPQLNQTAKDLIDRMDRDVEAIRREQNARNKIEPLTSQISRAYHRFPLGKPTRLHVSPDIYSQLQECLTERGGIVTGYILFCNCPVTEIPDLNGFRWVRERPNVWDCGPIHSPKTGGSK